MSKMASSKQANKASSLQAPVDFSNGIITVIIALYLLVESAPQLKIQDQMGLHWLLLSLLNICSTIYIVTNKVINTEQLVSIFKNYITFLYTTFFLIAGVSLLVAINPVEGIVVYTRTFTVLYTLLIIGIFLNNRLNILKNIAFIITIITFAQAFGTIAQFYREVGTMASDAIYNLQGTSGNKNVWAAAFVIKMPFVFYTFFNRKGFGKIIAFLCLSLTFFAVFLSIARAAYLGLLLELIILLGGFAFIYVKENNLKKYLVSASLIIGVLAITFFVSQNSLRKASKPGNSVTVTARVNSITENLDKSSNGRLAYWKSTLELIKKKPILGVGIGNWKLYTPLYINKIQDDNVFSKHPHNDFLEIAGETGIINALIFFSIFVVALILTVRIISSERSTESKITAVVAFAALSGYFVDAFFNFPAERPNIQLLFAITLALITANWLKDRQSVNPSITNGKWVTAFCVSMLILGTGATYVNAMVFKSSGAQYTVDNDLAAIDGIDDALPILKFDQVNLMFPEIPNIGENSETIGYKKAKYLQKEKRFDEAIRLLDSVHYQSPYIVYDDYLKCNIYRDEKKLDSAYKYAKKAAYAKPRNFYYYRMASYLAREHNDVDEIGKLFKNYNTYRKDQQSWSYYSLSMFYSKADRNEVKKVVDLGLKFYPTDSIMRSYKPYLPK